MAMIYRKMGQLDSPWPGATPLVTQGGPSAAVSTGGDAWDWGGIIKGATQLGIEITRAAGGAYDQPTATTYQPGSMPSGYAPKSGISTNTILLLGGGALVLFLLTQKKAAA